MRQTRVAIGLKRLFAKSKWQTRDYTKSPSSRIVAHRGISPAKFPILGKNVIMPRKSLPDRTDEINDSLSYNIGRNIYPCELLVSKLPLEQRVIKDRSQSANDCIWRSLAHLPVLVYV